MSLAFCFAQISKPWAITAGFFLPNGAWQCSAVFLTAEAGASRWVRDQTSQGAGPASRHWLAAIRSLWHLQEALGCSPGREYWGQTCKTCSGRSCTKLTRVLWEHYAPWFKWVLQLSYTKSVCDVHRCNLSTGSSLIHAMRSLFRPDLPTDAQLKVKWVTLAIEAVWAPVGTWQECSWGWVLGSDSAHGRGCREHLDVATPSIISCIYV